MSFYGFSIGGISSNPRFWGYTAYVPQRQLRVNVVDGSGDPVTGITVTVFDNSDNEVSSFYTTNGTALFSIPEDGDYYITTSETDRKQAFTYAGSDLTEIYTIKGKSQAYRITAARTGRISAPSNTAIFRY